MNELIIGLLRMPVSGLGLSGHTYATLRCTRLWNNRHPADATQSPDSDTWSPSDVLLTQSRSQDVTQSPNSDTWSPSDVLSTQSHPADATQSPDSETWFPGDAISTQSRPADATQSLNSDTWSLGDAISTQSRPQDDDYTITGYTAAQRRCARHRLKSNQASAGGRLT